MKKIGIIVSAWLAVAGAQAQVPVYLDDTQPIEARVSDALQRMTMEEKVALCHAQSKFSSAGVPRLGIPELWMSDGPHGVRAEINWHDWGYAGWTSDSCTAFPALTCLAATWNPALSGAYGKALGEEARYRKKDVILGPGVNIYRTPLNGRNFEYMGEDPYLAARLVVPYIHGVQANGVAACVKHFALNNQEVWRSSVDVQVSDRALHEIYLPAFKAAAIEGGAWSFMGSYNKFRGVYGCENRTLLRDLLKDAWGFDGVVITDWGGCHSTYASAMNGLDLEMGTGTNGLTTESKNGFDEYFLARPYREMLREGKIPQSVLDEQASRLLRLLFRTVMNKQRPYGRFVCADHSAVARQVGGEGIVLLKNEPVSKKEGALLPLDASRYRKILVVGENAVRSMTQGGGSSELKVQHEVSPLEGLKAVYGEQLAYVPGYRSGAPRYGAETLIPQDVTDRLRAEALEAARADDVDLVVFVGGLNKNWRQDCEDGDRISYGLPFGQQELLDGLVATGKRIVVVLLSGNAIELPDVRHYPAVVQAWYLGSEAGNALADVLSGRVNPSGKLPFSWPVKLQDTAPAHFGEIAYPGKDHREEYQEGILVGYRWHDTRRIAPLFPFGHGLSYTRFEYGKLSAPTVFAAGDSVTVTVSVRNAGRVAGKEVVQLYVGDEACSVERPLKELKAFRKVDLQPGESRTLTLVLPPDAFQFYDETAHAWRSEPGRFTLYVGSSSRDIRAVAHLTMK